MNQTLTVVLQSGSATWCRELTQEQLQVIDYALRTAISAERGFSEVFDAAADYDAALRADAMAALLVDTRAALLDIAYADREEG